MLINMSLKTQNGIVLYIVKVNKTCGFDTCITDFMMLMINDNHYTTHETGKRLP